MKMAKTLVTTVAFAIIAMPAMPLFAAEDDSEALGQFQKVVEGLNQRSFEMIEEAIDPTDLTNRILSHHAVQADVEEMFRADFRNVVEKAVLDGLPPPGSDIEADLISFVFQDGLGRASVRFTYPDFAYRFKVYDLRHDRRGRLKIVDWYDSSRGQLFSEQIGEELLTVKPVKATTRELLSMNAPTDLQLFQATEILKAMRDRQARRFFEIYDEFDEQLKREPLIAKHAMISARQVQDMGRFVETNQIFMDVYGDDPDSALMLSDNFLIMQDYEGAYAALRRFEQNFPIEEGALPAKLSALALTIEKPDEAEKFAVLATTNEPGFELGWWSMLRARASAEDYEGALEPLAHLEDDFGHRLDEAKLRRDKFRAFALLAQSQEFKDWRAGRD
jgi:hypothetical protein